MGLLKVVTVPPDLLPESERAEGYAVVLGDLILPGFYLGRYPTKEIADAACKYFASHYQLKAYPMDMPEIRRSKFTVINGENAVRYAADVLAKSSTSPIVCIKCGGFGVLPNRMEDPDGPVCACGRPSARESGACMVPHGPIQCDCQTS